MGLLPPVTLLSKFEVLYDRYWLRVRALAAQAIVDCPSPLPPDLIEGWLWADERVGSPDDARDKLRSYLSLFSLDPPPLSATAIHGPRSWEGSGGPEDPRPQELLDLEQELWEVALAAVYSTSSLS